MDVCITQAKQIYCCELWATGMSFLWNLGLRMCVRNHCLFKAEELFQLNVGEAAAGRLGASSPWGPSLQSDCLVVWGMEQLPQFIYTILKAH